MDSMAIWSRFTKSGKVEDYLVYRRSLESRIPIDDGDLYDEDEYGWADNQGTEYR